MQNITNVELPFKNLRKQHYVGPVPDGIQAVAQYRELCTDEWAMKVSTGDNVFSVGGDVCVVHNIIECSDGLYVVFKVFTIRENFFDYPLSSDFLQIFCVSQATGPYKFANVSEVAHKCVLLPYKDIFVAMPLLHIHSHGKGFEVRER